MTMLRICTTEGCETKTLGDQCLEHELARAIAPPEPDAENQLPLESHNARVPAPA
jgi:hypothetical protein